MLLDICLSAFIIEPKVTNETPRTVSLIPKGGSPPQITGAHPQTFGGDDHVLGGVGGILQTE